MHRQDRTKRREDFWEGLDSRAAQPASAREILTLFALSIACGWLAICLAVALRGALLEDGRLMSGYEDGMRLIDALPVSVGLGVAGMPLFSFLAPRSVGDTLAMLVGWVMGTAWMTGIVAIVF